MIRKIRGVLKVMSIQSTPLTVGALLFGYAAIEGTILTEDVIPLIVAGALAHWSFYSMNDLFDYKYDKRQRRTGKPLVSGEVSMRLGSAVSIATLGGSLLVAASTFNFGSLAVFVICFVIGGLYNYRNKETEKAFLFLAEWGIFIVLVGSIYAGEVNITSIVMALLLSVHMMWMTIEGNLKDVGNGEASLAKRYGCTVKEAEYDYLYTTAPFNILVTLVLGFEVLLILLIPVSDGLHRTDVLFAYLGIVVGVAILSSAGAVMRQKPFEVSEMTKDIALHECITVLGIAAVSLSYIGSLSVLTLGVGAILWGSLTQWLLYGHPLRFP